MQDVNLSISHGSHKRFRDMGDGTVAEVVSLPAARARPWADPAVAVDLRVYAEAEVQFAGAPAGYVPLRSLDSSDGVDGTWVPWFVRNGSTFARSALVSAPGIYLVDAGGWLKFTGGSGATLTLRAGN